MGKVLFYVENGIGWITLNRPEVRNAVDYEVMDLLSRFIEEAEKNEEVKLLVVTGCGHQAFCSGGDLRAFASLKTAEQAYKMLSRMGKVLTRLFFFPKPTVALLNGNAVGGGCELAAACDVRIASADAKVGFLQGTLGITTGWGGGAYLMEKVAKTEALDMLWSASRLTARQAEKKGFLQHVIDPSSLKEGCIRYLQRYLSQNSNVLAAYKEIYINSVGRKELAARVQQEVERCAKLWDSEEHHQAVARFLG